MTNPPQGFPRLLADIGATNARWGWQAHPSEAIRDIAVLPCRAHATLLDSARHYLAQFQQGRSPASVGIGIATAVQGDVVRMTNHAWSFSIRELARDLHVSRCVVINDFTALALSLPVLTKDDLRPLGGQTAPVCTAPLALLGPGTGLGVSGLVPTSDSSWSPIAGEGGHVTLHAADAWEAALIAQLRRSFEHVSAERVLSGPGLVNLYRAVCAEHGRPAVKDDPASISAAALAGTDEDCTRTVHSFVGFLGGVAGNLALTLGARGGVYVGGGIATRLGSAFDSEWFRERFVAKGRFRDYLAPIPCWLISADTPALTGMSQALDRTDF